MILKDKVALVTGGGLGIGRAIALAFAREGAQVVISDIDTASGADTLAMLESLGARALFVHADAASSQDHDMLIQRTLKHFGRLDVACNNAGISGEFVEVTQMSDDQWLRVINLNLNGVFYGCRAQLRALLAGGGGSVINVASILGAVGHPQLAHYTAAKHALLGLTKVLALEYGAQNIRVNAVGPGFINTRLTTENLPEQERPLLEAQHALGRIGEPQEVAELVVWLASDKASFVTGAYYPVDGGYLAR